MSDKTGDRSGTEHDADLRRRAELISQSEPAAAIQTLKALAPAEAERVLHELQVHRIELELQNDELRRVQDALEVSRERYFDLYDLAPVGYFTLSESGVVLEANLTGAEMLGVKRRGLVGRHFSHFAVAADADSYYLYMRKLFRTREPQAFEMRLSGKDGAQVSAWMEATVAAGDGGTSVCRVAISDISERNAIQEKLRRSQRLLETAGAMAQLGGWSVGLPGNEMTLTDETRAVLDFPKDSAPSLADVLALCDDGSRQSMATALQTCARHGTAFDKELELVSALGRRIVARVIGQAVRDSEGGIMGVEGALQDITVRREAEQARVFLESQLRESQKMEAIGTLAAGIANDFNNIVGIVLGNAELARREVGAQSRAIVSLDEIRKAGNRARDLVEQILSFSRQRPPSSRVLALASVVEDSVSLLRKALPAGVRIECHCAADVPSVVADPTQLQQVLLNLGNNAIEAMEGRSGSIDIDLSGLTLDERSARFDLNLRPGRYARIVVRDTGRGMDEATRQRIFEPFFTTKPIGQGTGLGLSVVHGIVQAHDGAIVVRSEPGSGSRFELYFPHAAAGTTPMAAEQGVGASEEGRGRNILCIDDDESQIFLIRRTLERSGYRVSACLDQREALDLLRSSPRPFDLVVTDFNMPGMNGLDLARAILKTHPALPVVVLTGYITDTLRAQAAEAGIAELISKPQETALLLRALQRLLPPASTVPLAGP